MKYEKEGREILELVGGGQNVRSLVHCATRLRFELADEDEADDDRISALPYVLKVIRSGGQYQVVIGPAVHDYYLAVLDAAGMSPDDTPAEKAGGAKQSPMDALLKVVSGAFSPIIPLMAGAGMIKAVLTLLTTLGLLSDASSTYAVLAAAGNACFYFLPVFLGYTISNQLGANPFVGAAVGAALLDPNFTGLIDVEGTDFLGLPLQAVAYGSTVFPIFIAAPIYSLIDRGLRKVVPQAVQLFLVPMLCLMVVVPFTTLVFGPFGNNVGDAVASAVNWLFESSTFVAGLVLGAVYPFLTVLGLHWGFTPITLQNLEVAGGDFIEGVAVCAVWAQIGIALGCFIRAKQGSKIRDIAGPTAITGFFAGVTEPILYSIIMEHKRLMAIVAVAGGLGGAWNGLVGATMDAYVFHNIFSIATLSYGPMPLCVVGMAISAVAGCVLTVLFGFTKEDAPALEPAATHDAAALVSNPDPDAGEPAIVTGLSNAADAVTVAVVSPVAGRSIPLSEVSDDLFASGAMGKGAAVVPEADMICAPCDATVTMVFDTKHAIGLTTPEGVELLVHIGIDTVKLGGEGFDAKVAVGDAVKAGDPMMAIDRELITSRGFSLDTPVLVMNSDRVRAVDPAAPGAVECGSPLMDIEL